MLVPYQLPQFGIVIIPQMVCKKRGKKKEKKKKGGKLLQLPFPFATRKLL
jgi:hypothetical protein